MNRRGLLGGILAAGVAPAFVGSSILMPVRQIVVPDARLTRAMIRSMLEAAERAANPFVNVRGEPLVLTDRSLWSANYRPRIDPGPSLPRVARFGGPPHKLVNFTA
jgi:hypothetical protein